MKILITGGTGYIGSHTCVELLNAGYEIVIVDNLSNSKREVLYSIEKITAKSVPFYEVDILDRDALSKVFSEQDIQAVIHFAGLKAVGESVAEPLKYYQNNVSGTLALLEVMQWHNIKNIVFSSSATVYGMVEKMPVSEDAELSTTNPYGSTKLMIEDILRDLYASDDTWGISLLRYFNPIGAHSSGLIGEDPNGIPNNLMPYVAQVAVGKLKELRVFGNDYPTHDGTGVRDYIHVTDLAMGHIKALEKILSDHGLDVYNLGTGKGYSVLDVVQTFERVTDQKIPYSITDRRPGDVASLYANPSKAKEKLGWVAERNLEDMCRDTWGFMCKGRLQD